MNLSIKPNYRKYNDETDKAFFASYLNTAKQNVFITFRDISERLGLGFDLNDDDNMMNAGLWKKLRDNAEPDVSWKIIQKIEEKFPYANYLAKNYAYFKRKERQAKPEDYSKVFAIFIQQLYDFRNSYTHAVHDPVETPKEIIAGMQLLFDAGRRGIKKRFKLGAKDMMHLVRLERTGKGKDAKTIERSDFHYSFVDDKDKLSEKGLAYFICLWLQRKDAQTFLKKLEGFKRSEKPGEKATLETYTFYSLRLPQPKLKSDNNSAGLLLDMVNELRRCPKHLYPLLSEDDKERFLKKAEEIETEDEYEALPILKRSSNRFYYFALKYFDTVFKDAKFHVDLGNYCFHVYNKDVDGQNRIRRWIKKMTAFGNLDDFSDEKRPQQWIDKIQRIEDRDFEKEDIYLTQTTPHYHINGKNIGLKFRHSYSELVKDNKIWPELPDFDKEHAKTTLPRTKAPDCWLSLYELPAMVFYHLLLQDNTASTSVEEIIRLHVKSMDLFFMDIENGVLNPGMNNSGFAEEISKRGLEKYFIPKPLIEYLTSATTKTFEDRADKMLEALIAETKQMLKKINNQKDNFAQKPGSKDYVEMKSGNMADFLARDIIRLQKPLAGMKGKPNSTEFQVLQAKLAFFGANKDSLDATFNNLQLTNSENPHPFLHQIRVDTCKGILDFYVKYLKKREWYLGYCKSKEQYHDYHFLKMGRRRKEHSETYYKNLANELRTQNVQNLPRGLFLKPILNILSSTEKTKVLAGELKQLSRVNTAYIIEKYFTQILDDSPQEFYTYNRSYEFLNKIYDDRKKNGMPLKQKFLTIDELKDKAQRINEDTYDNEILRAMDDKIEVEAKKTKRNGKRLSKDEINELKEKYWTRYKAFGENEKQIRLAKTCDMVLFMLVDHTLRRSFVINEGFVKKKKETNDIKPVEFGNEYKLSQIKAESDKGILELQTEAKIEMPYSYETNMDSLLKIAGAKSKLSDLQSKTILREQIKIKNYGDFRALMKDRRISSLLPYLAKDPIYFEALQKELELYQEVRVEVMDTIHNFERKAIALKGIIKGSDKAFISHEQILDGFPGYDPAKRMKIEKLRNAFCHSQYPAYLLYKDEINGDGINKLKDYTADEPIVLHNSPALQFKKIIQKYYDDIIQFDITG